MYLSAETIAAIEGVRRVHHLDATAIRTDKTLGDEVGLKNMVFISSRSRPATSRLNSTPINMRKKQFMSWPVVAWKPLGEMTQRVGPGDFIGFPAGGPTHETMNDGAEPLVCLVIGQRLSQDVVDYPRKGKRLYRNSGQRDMVDVAHIAKR